MHVVQAPIIKPLLRFGNQSASIAIQLAKIKEVAKPIKGKTKK